MIGADHRSGNIKKTQNKDLKSYGSAANHDHGDVVEYYSSGRNLVLIIKP